MIKRTLFFSLLVSSIANASPEMRSYACSTVKNQRDATGGSTAIRSVAVRHSLEWSQEGERFTLVLAESHSSLDNPSLTLTQSRGKDQKDDNHRLVSWAGDVIHQSFDEATPRPIYRDHQERAYDSTSEEDYLEKSLQGHEVIYSNLVASKALENGWSVVNETSEDMAALTTLQSSCMRWNQPAAAWVMLAPKPVAQATLKFNELMESIDDLRVGRANCQGQSVCRSFEISLADRLKLRDLLWDDLLDENARVASQLELRYDEVWRLQWPSSVAFDDQGWPTLATPDGRLMNHEGEIIAAENIVRAPDYFETLLKERQGHFTPVTPATASRPTGTTPARVVAPLKPQPAAVAAPKHAASPSAAHAKKTLPPLKTHDGTAAHPAHAPGTNKSVAHRPRPHTAPEAVSRTAKPAAHQNEVPSPAPGEEPLPPREPADDPQ